jgi:lipoyl(octanoyl) transferase
MEKAPRTWRLLPVIEAGGFQQMSIDQALLESAGGKGFFPTLRFYRFEPPALTLGRFQPLKNIDLEACRRRGIDVVRRPTGGKAILHKDDFTYSLVLPPSAGLPESVEESYAVICRGIIEALALLGVGAALVPRTSYSLDSVHACFSSPAAADLAVGERKLCGSAQTRKDGALLQHGTILDRDNGSLLFELFDYPAGEAEERRREFSRTCTCLEELGIEASWQEIAGAFERGFEAAFGVRLAPGELLPAELELARSLLQGYTSTAWSQCV